MLEAEGPDILTVATGDDKHTDIAVDGAESGIKGLFVEKPLATTLEDVDRILDACEARGIPISVGHTQRWLRPNHAVREAVRAGAIGPLHNIMIHVCTRGSCGVVALPVQQPGGCPACKARVSYPTLSDV